MVPTPDELAAMPWHKRDAALLRIRSLMSDYGLRFEPARRTRMTEAQKRRNAEYRRRQDQHRTAEIAALLDTPYFCERAKGLYGYDNFICDSGGSICEVVDPSDPEDPVLKALSEETLLIWIEGSDAHTAELCRRFDRAPKPMYYIPEILTAKWGEYLESNGQTQEQLNPDAFVRWTYAQALAHRQPRYQAMADNWGITVTAEQMAAIRDAEDFTSLIAETLEM